MKKILYALKDLRNKDPRVRKLAFYFLAAHISILAFVLALLWIDIRFLLVFIFRGLKDFFDGMMLKEVTRPSEDEFERVIKEVFNKVKIKSSKTIN